MTKLSTKQLVDLKLLLSVDGIGPIKIRNLLSKFKSVENILSTDIKSLQAAEGISSVLAKKIFRINENRSSVEIEINKELDKLSKIKGEILTVWDKDYPAILKKIYDPPIILYTKGKFNPTDENALAIVGTRNPTSYGKIQSEKFAAELCNFNITIVSGLARGIDTIAHHSVLNSNGRTIAVLGSGLDFVYPAENKKLFDEIAEKGIVISEYPLGTKPDAVNFPRRNRIISGLSVGVLIIETAINGGAMNTAIYANDQNREVYCIPGNIGIKQSEGTNFLIKDNRAKLVTKPEEIIEDLGLNIKSKSSNIQSQKIELNIFENQIYNCFANEPLQIDKIALLTKLSTSDCLVNLLSLEFKGLIKQLPGKMFAKI